MEIDFGSRQVRLLLAASAIWCVISASWAFESAELCTGGCDPFHTPFGADCHIPEYCSTDIGSFIAALLAYTSPVWGFWLAAWIFKWRLPLAHRALRRAQSGDEQPTVPLDKEGPRVSKFVTWPAAGFLLGFGAPMAGVTLQTPSDVGLLILLSAGTGAVFAIGGFIAALVRRRDLERKLSWIVYISAVATILLKLSSPTTGLALLPAALFVWAVKTPKAI